MVEVIACCSPIIDCPPCLSHDRVSILADACRGCQSVAHCSVTVLSVPQLPHNSQHPSPTRTTLLCICNGGSSSTSCM